MCGGAGNFRISEDLMMLGRERYKVCTCPEQTCVKSLIVSLFFELTYYITKKRVFDRIFQVVVRFGFHASPSSFCNDYTTSFDRCAHHSPHKVSPDVKVYTVRILHIFIVIYEIVSHRAAFFSKR